MFIQFEQEGIYHDSIISGDELGGMNERVRLVCMNFFMNHRTV